MKLVSNSWKTGDRLPTRYAAGKPDGKGAATMSDNVSPHFAWSDVPEGTKSFVLICRDDDVPSRGDDVNKADREVPADLPRVSFFHWVLVDLPASLREIKEGEFSSGGLTPKGKPGPASLHGARAGLNDYTGWFAGDPAMAGQYYGFDGSFPPFNDSLLHHYKFTLYALSVPRVAVEGAFTGPQVEAAIQPHVLAEATHVGVYTLNQRLL
ncbi:MAG: YbhB/YbcL family Raf kinase inhibitor-like protein [Rhizobacter sp.]